MPDYRRWMILGETFYFTVVTHDRRPIFDRDKNVRLLGEVMRLVRATTPFQTIAVVVLPDHLHCVWSLPCGDSDFSTRWKRIKREFTIRLPLGCGAHPDQVVSASRRSRGEKGVWQRRFWEHVVRDDDELDQLCDYIHYNPVKHGYASSPAVWPWSSFARFVASGHYPIEWGRTAPSTIDKVSQFVGE
jgi:putative transposase